MPPSTSTDFDRAYSRPLTPWGDTRIPEELRRLAQEEAPRSTLELGCGLGRFSRYLAQQGLRATGVDFSPVAIARARERVAADAYKPEFVVGDVTQLAALQGPFDLSFDVGCFHCLPAARQKAYVAEVHRLLAPGRVHLLWALDTSPSDLALTPEVMREVFAPGLRLREARSSRRRLARSHWYWLVRE